MPSDRALIDRFAARRTALESLRRLALHEAEGFSLWANPENDRDRRLTPSDYARYLPLLRAAELDSVRRSGQVVGFIAWSTLGTAKGYQHGVAPGDIMVRDTDERRRQPGAVQGPEESRLRPIEAGWYVWNLTDD